MIESTQLERVLVSVSRRYAPSLALNWQHAGDLLRLSNRTIPDFAAELARRGALVFGGEVPPSHQHQADLILKDWIDQWVRLHNLFADALFPTFRQSEAFIVEKQPVPIFLIATNARPVAAATAEIALPFVSHWHDGSRPNQGVLRDVITGMLHHMEAGKVERALSEVLHMQGVVLLRLLIDAQVQTHSPIPYVPGHTLPERLPDLDETARLDISDSETIVMTLSASPVVPRPPTLPEMDASPGAKTSGNAASFLPVYVPPFYPEDMAALEDSTVGGGGTTTSAPTEQPTEPPSPKLPFGGIDPAKRRPDDTPPPILRPPGKKN